MKDVGGAAGYRPRVRSAYYERVYVHSSEEQLVCKRITLGLQDFREGSRKLECEWDYIRKYPYLSVKKG